MSKGLGNTCTAVGMYLCNEIESIDLLNITLQDIYHSSELVKG